VLCGDRGVLHCERHPDVTGDAAADLDPVDVGSVRRVSQLEGGPARLQDRHVAAVGGERRDLTQPEQVAIEVHRALVVVGGDHQAHLGDLGPVGHVRLPPLGHLDGNVPTHE
jgi:hypothetical protein